ncbi:MAG: hypothetical protein ACREBU_21075 [Nitrososphaera sp.]
MTEGYNIIVLYDQYSTVRKEIMEFITSTIHITEDISDADVLISSFTFSAHNDRAKPALKAVC